MHKNLQLRVRPRDSTNKKRNTENSCVTKSKRLCIFFKLLFLLSKEKKFAIIHIILQAGEKKY